MKVRAIERGYYGLIIREPGDKFDVPDKIMADEKLRPSWVEPVKGSAEPETDDDEGERKPRRRRAASHAELEPDPDWVPPAASAKQVDE